MSCFFSKFTALRSRSVGKVAILMPSRLAFSTPFCNGFDSTVTPRRFGFRLQKLLKMPWRLSAGTVSMRRIVAAIHTLIPFR